jgi:hypothetical protein
MRQATSHQIGGTLNVLHIKIIFLQLHIPLHQLGIGEPISRKPLEGLMLGA